MSFQAAMARIEEITNQLKPTTQPQPTAEEKAALTKERAALEKLLSDNGQTSVGGGTTTATREVERETSASTTVTRKP